MPHPEDCEPYEPGRLTNVICVINVIRHLVIAVEIPLMK
jgi:hypothetical protein